jgi:hypothetical protein
MGSGEWPDAEERKAADFVEVKFVDESRNVVVPNTAGSMFSGHKGKRDTMGLLGQLFFIVTVIIRR